MMKNMMSRMLDGRDRQLVFMKGRGNISVYDRGCSIRGKGLM